MPRPAVLAKSQKAKKAKKKPKSQKKSTQIPDPGIRP
jgi:hypothetical protein